MESLSFVKIQPSKWSSHNETIELREMRTQQKLIYKPLAGTWKLNVTIG